MGGVQLRNLNMSPVHRGGCYITGDMIWSEVLVGEFVTLCYVLYNGRCRVVLCVVYSITGAVVWCYVMYIV